MDGGISAVCCLCDSGAKYRCPGCLRNTCSLTCVSAHKEKYGCSGRKQPGYIPVSEMTTQTLTKDAAFLDEVSRAIESTSRAFVHRQVAANSVASKHVKPTVLRKCCAERGIQMLSCPPVLSRHLNNYTIIRKNTVFWTVEWYFHEFDLVVYEKRFSERSSLRQGIERIFLRALNNKEKFAVPDHYRDLANLMALLPDLDTPITDRKYFTCDLDDSLRSNLEHSKINEYPRIFIILKRNLYKYKLVERRVVDMQISAKSNNASNIDDITNATSSAGPAE
ncbi:uncharacterized protein BBOV_IV007350 [Babesia bovis T2Bo]|uniref:uncharacterized protein n=1 Tax=Babesia bovis T2Bo TaxID=484906 RepID=UPI001DCE8838|nr:uncharacterized protein BBOV_IV007350 [Babesia bovis T2Bo]EDO07091.2 hypothetical protein BBOV_IV007350 [Babesia bovis T2Bo]